MPCILRILSAALLIVAVIAPNAGHAAANILFILDGSNSMWGQIDGKSKIETAQAVLTGLLSELPADTKLGLMVYGHRDKTSCDDIELLSPIGADDAAALTAKIRGLQPKGKTPIAKALDSSVAAFANRKGQNNNVVLISDGVETCGGDPCGAAARLAAADIKARVHVVGFDVGAKERRQLKCIPAAGHGEYFSAKNAEELKVAVSEVQQVAQAAPAEQPPAQKKYKEVFRDDFNGDELADQWEVANPDPDSFIVEDGGLLMLASGGSQSLDSGQAPNIFKLSKPLPKGDWVMTAALSVDFQTAQEAPFLGLYQDEKNYIVVQPRAYTCGNWGDRLCFVVEEVKSAKGKVSRFVKRLIWEKGDFENFKFAEAAQTIPQPITLRIVKEGRKYRGGILWSQTDAETKQTNEDWIDLENFTVLREKGVPALGIYQTQNSNGESTATVDWIKIETPE